MCIVNGNIVMSIYFLDQLISHRTIRFVINMRMKLTIQILKSGLNLVLQASEERGGWFWSVS